jgi:hypothetical protein
VGVGLWRAKRRLDDRDVLGAKDLVKAAGELRVAVADQERDVAERCGDAEVACLLATQRPSGLVVAPARWTRRVYSSMKNST